MNVKELKGKLTNLPDDMHVISITWTAEDAGKLRAEWETFKAENDRVLVLFPVN